MMLTFQDTVERLIDYLGGQFADVVLRDCKQASIEALRDLVQAHTWTYLYKHGRIITQASYTQGLVSYQASGGMYPNMITLSGGTWPDWAAMGVLRINNINYDVSARVGGTILTLADPQLPCGDFADAEYGLFQDTYSLPSDFIAHDISFVPNNYGGLQYVHPREWLWNTAAQGVLGDPVLFTITADPDRPQGLAIRLAPFPTNVQPIEFLYKRKANPLRVFKEATGTVATAIGSSTIVGTGTLFDGGFANNTVIRISRNSKPPTAEFGDNPAVFESKVIAVASSDQLTTWDAVPGGYASAPFTISSYVDIETGAMEQAYLRCCEMHLGMNRVLKDKPSAKAQYADALEVAKCADSRNSLPRTAGPPTNVRRRLKDYPIDLAREL